MPKEHSSQIHMEVQDTTTFLKDGGTFIIFFTSNNFTEDCRCIFVIEPNRSSVEYYNSREAYYIERLRTKNKNLLPKELANTSKFIICTLSLSKLCQNHLLVSRYLLAPHWYRILILTERFSFVECSYIWYFFLAT